MKQTCNNYETCKAVDVKKCPEKCCRYIHKQDIIDFAKMMAKIQKKYNEVKNEL